MLFGRGQAQQVITGEGPPGAARRAMIVLCIVVAVLGAFEIVRFAATDHKVLRQAVTQARLQVEREAVTPPPPETEGADVDGTAPGGATVAETRLAEAQSAVTRGALRTWGLVLLMLIPLYVAIVHRRRVKTRQDVSNTVTLMILLVGLVLLASRVMLQKVLGGFVVWGLADLIVLHAAVCAIMPWTWREATLPFLPLLLVWSLAFLMPSASDLDILDRVVAVIMSPVLFVPASGIAAWRYRRRAQDAERRMLGERVELLGGELSRARIVHDAMFPDAVTGHVCFEYEYQPIQEIGGDYVHVHACPDTGRLTLTLLDVAGHGLAAALTVNRLFGELERILAENAAAEPAEIMVLLNRYINLTMARHSLFATGTCMCIDPCTGTLDWVNAGHPPSMLRRAAGTVEDLATTTMLLGVLGSREFEPRPQQTRMAPGDVIIAYTDGAFEARNAAGERFGMDRIRETARFNPPPRSWPRFIAGAVAQHHHGHAEDDVLIAAVTLRSLRVPEPARDAATTPRVVQAEA